MVGEGQRTWRQEEEKEREGETQINRFSNKSGDRTTDLTEKQKRIINEGYESLYAN